MTTHSHIHQSPRWLTARSIGLWIFCHLVIACTSNTKSADSQPQPTPSTAPTTETLPNGVKLLTSNPFSSAIDPLSMADATSAANQEWLWALGQDNKMPRTKAAIFKQIALSRGALPEPLVPAIRKEIATNSKLQILQRLPLGIGGLMSTLFANDSKIEQQIRDSLNEKLQRYTPGGTQLGSRLAFRFFAFPSQATTGFDLQEQATRWLLTLSPDALWTGSNPLAYGDHGLQLLETLRLLVEWQYLYGLESKTTETGATGVYGGLTLDTSSSANTELGPFDPRTGTNGSRYLADAYEVSFPTDSSLNLAMNVQETWRVTSTDVTLAAQAKLWRASAHAFHRFRARNRGAAASLFESGSLFPSGTDALPLIALPTLSSLLDGPFIDAKSRRIRGIAQLPNSNAASSQQNASLHDLIYLTQALHAWCAELKDLSDVELSEATKTSLKGAPTSIKTALQLVVQTVLAEHMGTISKDNNLSVGRPLLQNAGGNRTTATTVSSIALAAETLYSLAVTEQSQLNSPLLRARLVEMTHWVIATLVAPQWQSGSLSALDALWLNRALEVLANYPEIKAAIWFDDLNWRLASALNQFDDMIPLLK